MTLVQKKTGGGAWQVTHERAGSFLPHEILVGQQIPISDGSTAALPWGQQEGSDLLDLTDPIWPKFRSAGVYAISLTVEQQDSPSGSFKCLMGFTTPSQREVAAYSPQIFAASQFPIRAVAIALTATAEEDGGIILNVTSTIGGGAQCLYRIYLAVVQKVG